MPAHIPAAGETAPDFTLVTTTGQPVTLSSFRGQKNVLLAFFPLAFTSTCSAELCAFTDDFSSFESKGVMVIPISVDAVPSLKAYKEKLKIGPELASDFRRDVARAYGVLNDEKFFANRSYFLIDKAGVVRWSHVEKVNLEKRENAEILAEIAKLPA
ncbi:MAG TPA: redoxin domain-containing protein [Gemmatimonadaceae bacterium]|jgi:peroxiredoxin|nr:redoxin domain-containing protein [Gemmatimonadaceae bacterium]